MKTYFEKFLKEPEHRRLFEQESLVFKATEQLAEVMEEEGINKSILAQKLGKSKAFVTQVLSGSRNMTLRTLADFLFVLGYRAELDVYLIKEQRVSNVVQLKDVYQLRGEKGKSRYSYRDKVSGREEIKDNEVIAG